MTERVVQIRVSVLDDDANKRLDALRAKLDHLTKDIWKIRVRLDDGGANAQLDKLIAKLDRISKKDYTPKVGVDGLKKFNAEMDKANARLDKFNRRRVRASVSVGSGGGGLGGGGGGGGGGGSTDNPDDNKGFFSRTGAFLVGAGPATGIGALIALGSSLLPALVPLALGLGIGGGVGGLAIRQGTAGLAAIKADQQALATARAALIGRGNNTPSNRLALQQALTQLQSDRAQYGAFLPLGRQAGALGPNAVAAFVSALTQSQGIPGSHWLQGILSPLGAHGLGGPSSPSGGNVPGLRGSLQGPMGTPIPYSPSFITGLSGILKQLDGFIKQIGPGLGAMFRASLPIIQMFVMSLETLAKTLMPAFTQSMKTLAPVLPIIQGGFKLLAQGIAGFILALGPGTKDAAIIFKTGMMVVKGLLIAIGVLASALAITFVKIGEAAGVVSKYTRNYWDELRHNTAVIFDGIRHDTAHIWDIIFNNTVGLVSHMTQDITNQSHALQHNIASTFDLIRHTIAAAWDAMWTATVNATKTGISDVVRWVKGLPGQILAVLKSLSASMMSSAKSAIGSFLSGLQSGGAAILSWIKSFFASIPSTIMHLLGMSPPHPGSAFYDLGANFMHHVEAGMKSRAASVTAAAHGVAGGSAAAYAHALANKIGWGGQWGDINALEMSEAGWNLHAQNPTSRAYGIAQFINGPSEYYQYGGNPNTVSGQVIAFFNYIRQRYGDPANAWAFHLRHGWYDQGGKLPPGLSLALNTTGHDEIHTTGPVSGGDTYIINTMQPGFTDAEALNIIKTVRKYKVRHGNQALGIG